MKYLLCARHLPWDLISCSIMMKSILFMEKHEFFKSQLGEFMEKEETEAKPYKVGYLGGLVG